MTALKLVHNASLEPARKDYINRIAQNEPRTGVMFSDFIMEIVRKRQRKLGTNSMKNYKTLLRHLKDFSEVNDTDIYTNSVGEDFLYDFITYLEDKDLKQSYIKNVLGLTKSMAAKAGTLGYAVDKTYDEVNINNEQSFSVFLSMNEITRIYYFRGLTIKQERIRDLFVVGCLTALRYSDYSTLTSDNFIDNFIIKVTKKTKAKVKIPQHDYVREIYSKYDGEISSFLSIQHFNRYIKQICKKVGLDMEIKYHYTRGGKIIYKRKQKWELISSHTARRSAATNLYMTGRMKTYDIMKLTGHTTEKSFFRYIKTTVEDSARQISGDYFFRT